MLVINLKRLLIIAAAAAAAAAAVFSAHTAVRTFSPKEEAINVPILMYHLVLEGAKGNKYIVSPSDFEDDLKYLRDNGYTTVVMQDLIDYVYNNAELPEKPVVLTFDDGYYNNYVYAYPLLKKYNSKAVISIVGAYTDLYSETPDTHVNYAHLSWDNVKEMADSGYVEIQNHTYNLHSLDKGRRGSKKNSGESEQEYDKMLRADIGALQEECLKKLDREPDTFTYPFGLVSKESLEIIKSLGFKASLSCEEGINKLERSPEQLYKLKRCIRTPSRSAALICSEIL